MDVERTAETRRRGKMSAPLCDTCCQRRARWVCSQCKQTAYCSHECQRVDWLEDANHRKFCNRHAQVIGDAALSVTSSVIVDAVVVRVPENTRPSIQKRRGAPKGDTKIERVGGGVSKVARDQAFIDLSNKYPNQWLYTISIYFLSQERYTIGKKMEEFIVRENKKDGKIVFGVPVVIVAFTGRSSTDALPGQQDFQLTKSCSRAFFKAPNCFIFLPKDGQSTITRTSILTLEGESAPGDTTSTNNGGNFLAEYVVIQVPRNRVPVPTNRLEKLGEATKIEPRADVKALTGPSTPEQKRKELAPLGIEETSSAFNDAVGFKSNGFVYYFVEASRLVNPRVIGADLTQNQPVRGKAQQIKLGLGIDNYAMIDADNGELVLDVQPIIVGLLVRTTPSTRVPVFNENGQPDSQKANESAIKLKSQDTEQQLLPSALRVVRKNDSDWWFAQPVTRGALQTIRKIVLSTGDSASSMKLAASSIVRRQ